MPTCSCCQPQAWLTDAPSCTAGRTESTAPQHKAQWVLFTQLAKTQLGRQLCKSGNMVISMGKNRHGHLLLFFMVSFTTKTECSHLISDFKKGKPQPLHSTAVLLESTSRDLHLLLSLPARQHGCRPLLRNKHTFLVLFFSPEEGDSKQTKTKGRRNRVLCMTRVPARWRTDRGGNTTTRRRKGTGTDAAVPGLPRRNLPDPVPDGRHAASLRTSMAARPAPGAVTARPGRPTGEGGAVLLAGPTLEGSGAGWYV